MRKALIQGRVVDNMVGSTRGNRLVWELVNQIKVLLEGHCFPLKELDSTLKVMGNLFNHEDYITNILGMRWDRVKDEISPNWRLNLSSKVKGIHKEENLSVDNIENFIISRNSFNRLYASVFDPLGIFAGHCIMSIKINLKRICNSFSMEKSV